MDIQKVETVDKPWGHEEILIQTNNYVMKRITITRGKRMSLQYHEQKEETIYVISGTLIVWKSEDFYDHITLDSNDVYHVVPRQVHRFGAPDHNDTVILECSTTQLTDVVRLADDFNRT